jgi:hypothetical protein
MAATIAPYVFNQYFSGNIPLDGGKILTKAAGTNTDKVAYTDGAGTIPATNPIILDSEGRASFFLGDGGYKLILTDKNDVVIDTVDNITVQTIASTVNTIADMKALAEGLNTYVNTLGYYSAGDGGHSTYYWDSINTDADDGVGTIIPDSTPVQGRYKLLPTNNIVSLRQGGCKIDGVTDDLTQFIKTDDYCNSNNLIMLLKSGTINFSSDPTLNAFLKLDPGGILKWSGFQPTLKLIIDKNDNTQHFDILITDVPILSSPISIRPEWFLEDETTKPITDATIAASVNTNLIINNSDLNVEGNIGVKDNIRSIADSNTYIDMNLNNINIVTGGNSSIQTTVSETIINEAGLSIDFRVETNSIQDALCLDGTAETFTINVPVYVESSIIHEGDSDTKIDFTTNNIKIITGGQENINLSSSGIIINEAGLSIDFRVETDTTPNALLLDGTAETFTINVPVYVESSIIHEGDSDTNIIFNTDQIDISAGGLSNIKCSTTETVINEAGAAFDFRVETDTITDAFKVNGTSGIVSVNTFFETSDGIRHLSDTDTNITFSVNQIDLYAGNIKNITCKTTGIILNEDSNNMDFRAESDISGFGLALIGATGNVGIGINPLVPLHLENGNGITHIKRSSDSNGIIIDPSTGDVNIDTTAGYLAIKTAGSESFRVDTSQKIIIASGKDLYTVPDTDYSGTSILTGATGGTFEVYYKLTGKTCFVDFYLDSTNNATNLKFTLPFNASRNCYMSCAGFHISGGINLYSFPAMIDTGTNEIDFYARQSKTLWNGSGSVILRGSFHYEIA